MHFLDIDRDVDHMLDTTHQAGRLGVNINTAFAVLDVGAHTDDVLVVGGDASEGGLWLFKARETPEYLSTISNWTPLLDSTVVSKTGRAKTEDSTIKNKEVTDHQRVFICNGRAKHGALTEIQYGMKASKRIQTVDLGQTVSKGTVELWGFQDHHSMKTYIMISHPRQTYIMTMQNGEDLKLMTDAPGLSLNARTIAVGMTDDSIIQITESCVWAFSLRQQANADAKGLLLDLSPKRIMTACFNTSGLESYIMLLIEDGHANYLQIGQVFGGVYDTLGLPTQLDSAPSCCFLYRVGDQLLGLIGTLADTVQIFATTAGRHPSFCKVSEYSFPGDFAICDSFAMMKCSHEDTPMYRLICGLRNGSVQSLALDMASLGLHFLEQIDLGHTSVSVKTDILTEERVLVHCEKTVWALEYRNNPAADSPMTLTALWLSDPIQPNMQKARISAVTQIGANQMPTPLAGCMLCVDDTLLHFVFLKSNARLQNMPRQLSLDGTPVRMIYSPRLDRIITLSMQISILHHVQFDVTGRRSRPGKRTCEPFVTFIDVTTANAASGSSSLEPDGDAEMIDPISPATWNKTKLDRKPGERFLGLTEWFPELGGKEWHMIVINTSIHNTGHGATGRLLMYAVIHKEGEAFGLSFRKAIEFKAPVWSVAACGAGALIIYNCGNALCMRSLEIDASSNKRFRVTDSIKVPLRSTARHITIASPYVYVSTSENSLQVYRFDKNALTYQQGDQVARSGISHIYIPEKSMILATDTSGSLTGLGQPPDRNIANALPTVFEAALPQAIVRLHRIVRPAWCRLSVVSDSNESIIGTSTNGVITQIDILDRGIGLLQFIQSMAMRSAIICPLRDSKPRRHLEPSASNPRFLHIDGDVLHRMSELGGESLLRDMLAGPILPVPNHNEHRTYDYSSVEERIGRFRELASEVVQVEGDDWIRPVVRWIRFLLRSAL